VDDRREVTGVNPSPKSHDLVRGRDAGSPVWLNQTDSPGRMRVALTMICGFGAV